MADKQQTGGRTRAESVSSTSFGGVNKLTTDQLITGGSFEGTAVAADAKPVETAAAARRLATVASDGPPASAETKPKAQTLSRTVSSTSFGGVNKLQADQTITGGSFRNAAVTAAESASDTADGTDTNQTDGSDTNSNTDPGGEGRLSGKLADARDPDGDGVLEDVNGDGQVTVLDVQLLNNAVEAGVAGERFDIDGDGTVDRDDATALFNNRVSPGNAASSGLTGAQSLTQNGLRLDIDGDGDLDSDDASRLRQAQKAGTITSTGSFDITQDGAVTIGDVQALNQIAQNERPEAIASGLNPPTDVDGDGSFRDVNGDGEVTTADVQAFGGNFQGVIEEANELRDGSDQTALQAFDFNGDGTLSQEDTQALFEQV